MLHKGAYDSKHGKGLKILTPKQMHPRLSIALAKVKAGNTSKKLSNHTFFVSRKKEITKKIYKI